MQGQKPGLCPRTGAPGSGLAAWGQVRGRTGNRPGSRGGGSFDLSLASGIFPVSPSQPANLLIPPSAFPEAPPTGLIQGRSKNVSVLSLEPSPTARKGELTQDSRRPEAWR